MKQTMIAIVVLSVSLPVAASAVTPGDRADRLDRIEDRIDRRESRIDEAVDLGRRDVIEDRLDRIESVRDRRGFDGPSRFDRHERRSWWRIRRHDD